MWPFKKEFEELHFYLKNSFQGVKEDTSLLHQWVQHLHQKNLEQEGLLLAFHQKLQQQEHHLSALYQSQASLRQAQAQLHPLPPPQNPSPQDRQNYLHLHQRIEQLSQKVDLLLEKHTYHSQKLDHHHQRLTDFHQKLQELETQHSRPKPSFKEKIVQTFSRHSKNYLKNLIFQYLEQHEKISALQLKDIIVDQQGLASKSTFYRILSEIEESPKITVIKDGKQKYFLFKTVLSQ